MNTLQSSAVPSFVPLRKTQESLTNARFQVKWAFGVINTHLRHALVDYMSTKSGIVSVDFPENSKNLTVKYDSSLVSPMEIAKTMECPQLQLLHITD